MIRLDTNILVRYFTQDDAKQCALVNRCIDGLSRDAPGFISSVTLCELVRVLQELYAVDKLMVVRIVRQIIDSDQLVLDNKAAMRDAVNVHAQQSLDFGDAVIAQLGKKKQLYAYAHFGEACGKNARISTA